jgi:hypothetical protein
VPDVPPGGDGGAEAEDAEVVVPLMRDETAHEWGTRQFGDWAWNSDVPRGTFICMSLRNVGNDVFCGLRLLLVR